MSYSRRMTVARASAGSIRSFDFRHGIRHPQSGVFAPCHGVIGAAVSPVCPRSFPSIFPVARRLASESLPPGINGILISIGTSLSESRRRLVIISSFPCPVSRRVRGTVGMLKVVKEHIRYGHDFFKHVPADTTASINGSIDAFPL